LIPPPDLAAILRRTIARLSDRFETPRFDPHVTLLGGVRRSASGCAESFDRLAAVLERAGAPIEIAITGVAHSADYYRCVCLEVGRGAALLQARSAARRGFGVAREEGFDPHVSLLYGRLPAETRERVARRLAGRAGAVWAAAGIALVRTSGPPRAWRTLERVGLTAGPPTSAGAGRRSRPS